MHKAVDGNFHAIGELEVVPKDLQWRLFEQVEKEMSKYKTNQLVILAPLPRYLENPCCNQKDHMTSMKKEEYKKKLEEDIYKLRQNLKDFAFRKGWKSAVTVSTWGRVKKLDNIWEDNIHLTEDGYFAISEAVVEAVASLRGKRRGQECATPQAKKQRLDSTTPGGQSGRGRDFSSREQSPRGSSGVRRRGGGRSSGGGGWSRGWSRGHNRGFLNRRGNNQYY
jgi:hypothetical protein